MPAIDTIQLRRDTAANWTSANPTLAAGEEGYETTSGKRKVGDGSTAWTSLPYVTTDGALPALTGAVTSVGNATSLGSFTSSNLATALTDETGSGAAVFGTSPVLTGSPSVNNSGAYSSSPLFSATMLDDVLEQTDTIAISLSSDGKMQVLTSATSAGEYVKGSRFSPINMTGPSAPTPYVVAQSTEFSSSYAAWNCFTANTSIIWATSGVASGWASLDLGSGNSKICFSYSLTGLASGTSNYMAKTWTFEGSNDNSTWDTLDTRSSETSWGDYEVREYDCATVTTAYRYFRLNVTANNGASFLEVNQLVFYEAVTGAITPNLVLGAGSVKVEIGSNGNISLPSLPIYANNSAAITGGLSAGMLYRTNGDPDPVCVVH